MTRKSSNPWWWKFILGRARQIMRWSPSKKAVILAAKNTCAECHKKSSSLEADHIEPVVALGSPFSGDWNVYFDRMFNGTLQALCRKCHSEKTKKENEVRKELRAAKKFVAKKDSSSEVK